MIRRINAFNIPQYQRSSGKQAARCFQGKTFGITFAHFIDERVGVVFDQFQRMFAVKSAHQQFHLRAVVPRTFDNACRGFFIIHTNNDGAGVWAPAACNISWRAPSP